MLSWPNLLVGLYAIVLSTLCLYGLHRYWILYLYLRHGRRSVWKRPAPAGSEWPRVTVQLPVFNERYVLRRLVECVCALDYPRERLQIQILDDSTDDTQALARELVEAASARGVPIHHIHRGKRTGYKAGALAAGLAQASGELIAVFDADFLPAPHFLKLTVPYFRDPSVGMVQARWGHLNADYSLLTRLQSIFLDGHFLIEHTARNRSGAFFNFNGTAGLWRRRAIEDSGGWQADTLTEDLDLSYRAQMAGWRFVFLPDVVCPGELPVEVHSFRSQQYRWAKGSLQVARKILPRLLAGSFSWKVKLEACAHLTANLGYVFVVFLSLLFLPSMAARLLVDWPGLWMLELAAFLLTVASIGSFYAIALKDAYPDWIQRCRNLPLLMAFGMGMCVNNARAALHALAGVPSGFERTAKFNILKPGEAWKDRLYRNVGFSYKAAELGLLLYMGVTFLYAIETGHWASLPFISFYLVGLGYMGLLSLEHRFGGWFGWKGFGEARSPT